MAHKLSLSWLERFLEEACESLPGKIMPPKSNNLLRG